MKVAYRTFDGHESTAYVHAPERVFNLEAENGSPITDYKKVTCGSNKHSGEPVALMWDGNEWRQLR